jgi:hypothetical protein
MRITKSQLKELIKEEVLKFQKLNILENRKKEIKKELRILSEQWNSSRSFGMFENNENYNNLLNYNYRDYVNEKLSTSFSKEVSDWFTDDVLWNYKDLKEFINPDNNDFIDKLGESFYNLSQFYRIADVEDGYSELGHNLESIVTNVYTDNKKDLIDDVDILLNYLKAFKIKSKNQIDALIDNSYYPSEFVFKIIDSKELKRYFIDQLFNKTINFKTPRDSYFEHEFLKYLRPEQLEKIRNNIEFKEIYPELF